MNYTALFILVLTATFFFGFNAILALIADHLPEWIAPKGYYDDDD